MNTEEIYDGCLSENFRCIISGSSGCGKSSLIQKIMINANGLYPHKFENIVYCYGVQTNELEQLKKYFKENIEFKDHIPQNLLELCTRKTHNLLVLDDLDDESFSSPLIAAAFTKWSHHGNFSLILSTQNIYSGGSKRITLMRNATHIILFPNYLDHTVPRLVGQRVLPGKLATFMAIFDYATKHPFGYLAIFGTGSKVIQFRTDITCPVQKVFLLE